MFIDKVMSTNCNIYDSLGCDYDDFDSIRYPNRKNIPNIFAFLLDIIELFQII